MIPTHFENWGKCDGDKFYLKLTRNNLKTVGNMTATNCCRHHKNLILQKCSYALRIDQLRLENVENVPFSSFSSVHTMSFSKCAG